jgi:hypothetical protein
MDSSEMLLEREQIFYQHLRISADGVQIDEREDVEGMERKENRHKHTS